MLLKCLLKLVFVHFGVKSFAQEPRHLLKVSLKEIVCPLQESLNEAWSQYFDILIDFKSCLPWNIWNYFARGKSATRY